MAVEEKSIFEELAPYAKMVVVPGVTVGNLTYSNQQDLYSSAVFATSAAGVVAANTTVQFYQGALGESAIQQGYTGGTLSLAQTNNKFSKGQAPANQVYIATHAGFLLSQISGAAAPPSLAAAVTESLLQTSTLALAANGNKCDVYQIAQNFSWDLTIGAGITRTIGTLSEYTAPGVFSVTDEGPAAVPAGSISGQNGSPCAEMKRLQVPLVFPPLVKVQITASNGSPFILLNTATETSVQIKMILRGYLMTMPVG
jgi:hypothetical protein